MTGLHGEKILEQGNVCSGLTAEILSPTVCPAVCTCLHSLKSSEISVPTFCLLASPTLCLEGTNSHSKGCFVEAEVMRSQG